VKLRNDERKGKGEWKKNDEQREVSSSFDKGSVNRSETQRNEKEDKNDASFRNDSDFEAP